MSEMKILIVPHYLFSDEEMVSTCLSSMTKLECVSNIPSTIVDSKLFPWSELQQHCKYLNVAWGEKMFTVRRNSDDFLSVVTPYVNKWKIQMKNVENAEHPIVDRMGVSLCDAVQFHLRHTVFYDVNTVLWWCYSGNNDFGLRSIQYDLAFQKRIKHYLRINEEYKTVCRVANTLLNELLKNDHAVCCEPVDALYLTDSSKSLHELGSASQSDMPIPSLIEGSHGIPTFSVKMDEGNSFAFLVLQNIVARTILVEELQLSSFIKSY
jgi:hypothetical protein